jgi:hypothetical protein
MVVVNGSSRPWTSLVAFLGIFLILVPLAGECNLGVFGMKLNSELMHERSHGQVRELQNMRPIRLL